MKRSRPANSARTCSTGWRYFQSRRRLCASAARTCRSWRVFLSGQFCGEPVRLSRPVMELLRSHSWPGNVRELRHALERASILLEDGNVLLPEHLFAGAASASLIAPDHNIRDF